MISKLLSILLLGVILAFFTNALIAQRVVADIVREGHKTRVTVSNPTNQVLTAIAMTVNHTDGNGRGVQSFYLVDSVYEGRSGTVAPGQKTTFEFVSKQPGVPPPSVEVHALVFGDGKADGDKAWAIRMIERRTFLLSSLEQVIAIVSAAANAGRSAGDVIQALRELDSKTMDDVAIGMDQKLANKAACLDGYGNLENNPGVESGEALRNVLDHLKARRNGLMAAVRTVN